MQLSSRVQQVKPSLTLAITAKAKQMRKDGLDVISLSAGEPDFDTPDFIKNAAIKALKDGCTKYTPASGVEQLKELIIQKFQKDNNISYEMSDIVVSNGAKHSIYNIFQVLLNEGDEVIIPAPYWLSYPEIIRLSGGTPVILETKQEDRFKVKPADLKSKITDKTKAIIVNSPSNPTGVIYSEDELREIAQIAVENNIFIISDEIYEKLIYGDKKHVSIASFGEAEKKLTFTVNGLSKAYSMTGWRLGYLAGPKEITSKITSLQSHSTSNPNSFAQYGAIEALANGEEENKKMRKIFEARKALMLEHLSHLPKVSTVEPDGAFYAFVNISETGLTSSEFSDQLLEKEKVAVVPGAVFGSDAHIRLSFATSDENIIKGVARIKSFINSL